MTSPTAPTIDANGITAPRYAEILAYLQTQYRAIFGADVYLGNDSQDGQFIGILAAAINDANAAAIAVYNAFSPATAQGNGLSSVVKINGISRAEASNSQVNVLLTGVAGTTITNGVVQDANSVKWSLPSSVVIPPAGTIIVTATCQKPGAIAAAIGSVTVIATPTLGWQSVTNPSSASLGAAMETDAALRRRQAQSVALPSTTVLAGLMGALQAIDGVTQVGIYENDTGSTDANGLPAHSIAAVVQGGDSLEIAQAILNHKTPGAYTHGTTSVTVHDAVGIPYTIRYFVPTDAQIKVKITLHALTGYSATVEQAIKDSIAAYINALPFGQDVLVTRLYLPALLSGAEGVDTYELVTLEVALGAGSFGTSDIPIAFNAQATCSTADITITAV